MEPKRALFRRLPLLLLLLAASASAVAASGLRSIEAIERLVEAGAAGLALRVIAEEQPQLSDSPVAWQRWERLRLAILEAREDWPAVIARVAEYPPGLA
ncbi:MAG: hypothetical protein GWN98_05965, partial [Gammaproteobacteria bacterium]|nr:hypothetical protein [Gammaproteobacteria bacterium]